MVIFSPPECWIVTLTPLLDLSRNDYIKAIPQPNDPTGEAMK
jgi:hypothetical protein